jgi:hypothetical protein
VSGRAANDDKVHALLAQSLLAWGCEGVVRRAADGAFLVSCAASDIRVERAPPDLPFRWMVTAAGRKRGAVALPAVLRQLRAALDPDHAGERVRIALAPLVPP